MKDTIHTIGILTSGGDAPAMKGEPCGYKNCSG